MLTLNDGRSELWQWDTGRTVSVDADCSQVHFSNKVFGRSIDVDVVDGVAIIPDVLLQTDKELIAWAFVGTSENGYTKISKVFKVNKRNKPADYVFTPPEQTTLGELIERLDKIEESQDPDAIKNAVDDYLANNPIMVKETDPTVPEWAKQPTPPDVKIPDKLPNPHSITFTGAVDASYDGSNPVEIKIPDSGDKVDLTGYATEQWVKDQEYLTEVPEGYVTEEWLQQNYQNNSEAVYVTTMEKGDTVVSDVPFADIVQAYNDKKPVYFRIDMAGIITLPLVVVTEDNAMFSACVTFGTGGVHVTTVVWKNNRVDSFSSPVPTRPEDIGAQPAGNYLTEVPSGYATEEFVTNKIAEAELGGEEVDLSGYAQKSELPTKVSQLQNDSGFITGYTEFDPTVPSWAKQASKPSYSKSEVGLGNVDNEKQYSASNPPPYPVTSVNGETGAVRLTASDVGARSASWMPTAAQVGAVPVERTVNGKSLAGDIALSAEDVGARSSTWTPTASDVGAEKSGTAASAVSAHNTNTDAHNDIRLLITGLTTRLDALANSDDETLDQMAEVVAYIKDNRDLIDQITTGKVSYTDIVNNLTTNVGTKPLAAAQGVALKALIDAITVPTKLSQLTNDSGYITGYTETDPTVPSWAKAVSKPSYTKSEVGLGNVDNVKQYSANNPPPYPVTSVNGKTGTVTLDASAVGALSESALPTAVNNALAQAKASGEFDGSNGTSVTVKSVSESTADGGSNVVTFSDGKTLTVKNGSKGSKGDKGDAYTLTDTDKNTIVNAVIAALPVYNGEVV